MTADNGELDPVAPELFVPDVNEAIAAYTQTFGFVLQRKEPRTGDHATFAIIRLGKAMVMLMYDAYYAGPRAELDQRGSGLDIRIMVDDVDATYTQAKTGRWPILHDIGDREYGLRDFITRDPNGFRLRFASLLR